jgi:thiamine-phosphate diphosphorylase
MNTPRGRPDPATLGLHVITGARPGRDRLSIARAAAMGGADVVQLRAPELAGDELVVLAQAAADLCRSHGVRFVVNDRVDVALAVRADGVHLGQRDSFETARRHLGAAPLLGVSVGGPADVPAAEAAGADYLGVTVWASATKPEARGVGLDGLEAVAAAASVPIVGVGGVNASNAGDVIAAGAAGVAVVSAVSAASDPVGAVRELVGAVRAARAGAR